MIKKLLIIIALLFYASSSYAYLTDTDVHERPGSPPAFNATTKKATDTVFGSIILRLTGAVGSSAVYESAETQNYAPIQHFANPWNCTGDLFVIWADRLSTGGGTRVDLYSFDPTTFTATWERAVGSPVAVMNYNRYISWSRNTSLAEADRKWLLYAVNSNVTPNRVQRWNLDTVSAHDELAANSTETIFSDAEGIQACTVDETDDLFCYWNNAGTKVKVYKKSTTTTYTLDVSGWVSFDECQITPKGYVYVKGKKFYNGAPDSDQITPMYDYTLTNEIRMQSYSATLTWNNQTGNFTNGQVVTGGTSGRTGTIVGQKDDGTSGEIFIYQGMTGWSVGETITDPLGGSATLVSRLGPDDFAGKHSGYGSYWVNEANYDGGYLGTYGYFLKKCNPANGKGTPTKIFTRPANGAGTMHPSYWGSYVIGGMFRNATYDPTKVYLNEIIRVKDDGTEVARLAHSWSSFYSSSYDEIPSFVDPTGNYVIFYSNWNGADANARHDVFIVQIDAEADTTPPVISNPLPSGIQACTSNPRNITLQVTTDENATCKYDTSDTTYDLMANTFSTTGGMSHSQILSLSCVASYTRYVRCMDGSSNKNTSSTSINFSIGGLANMTLGTGPAGLAGTGPGFTVE